MNGSSMNSTRIDKRTPIRPEKKHYDELRYTILKRDGWRCQFCGAMTNLEVHHQQFRSHSGDDSEENLITICHTCHETIHGTKR